MLNVVVVVVGGGVASLLVVADVARRSPELKTMLARPRMLPSLLPRQPKTTRERRANGAEWRK